jgi:hypothetical protein
MSRENVERLRAAYESPGTEGLAGELRLAVYTAREGVAVRLLVGSCVRLRNGVRGRPCGDAPSEARPKPSKPWG